MTIAVGKVTLSRAYDVLPHSVCIVISGPTYARRGRMAGKETTIMPVFMFSPHPLGP